MPYLNMEMSAKLKFLKEIQLGDLVDIEFKSSILGRKKRYKGYVLDKNDEFLELFYFEYLSRSKRFLFKDIIDYRLIKKRAR